MRSIVTALFCFFFLVISGQEKSHQQDINSQVWKTFIKGFNDRDNQLFGSVHSKDFIRVIRDNQTIFGYDEAFADKPDEVKQQLKKWKRNIELRFIERIASEDKAFEVGYYKTSVVNSETNESRVGYGKFHVLLRKEKGQWKILMDSDVQGGVDEAIFQSANPME